MTSVLFIFLLFWSLAQSLAFNRVGKIGESDFQNLYLPFLPSRKVRAPVHLMTGEQGGSILSMYPSLPTSNPSPEKEARAQ